MKSKFEVVLTAIDKLYAKKKFPTLESNLIQVKEMLASHGWEMTEYASILCEAHKEGKL